jgi:glycine dehydrogenase subunit 1
MALRATIYLETLGPGGLRRVAETSVRRTHELAAKLAKIEGVYVAYKAPYFHEVVIELPHPPQTLERLLEKGFLGGLYLQPYYRDLRDHVLMCCTERNSSPDIDAFVQAVREAIQ